MIRRSRSDVEQLSAAKDSSVPATSTGATQLFDSWAEAKLVLAGHMLLV